MKIFKALIKKDFFLFVMRRHFAFFSFIVGLSTVLALVSGFTDYKHRMDSFQKWRAIQSTSLTLLQFAESLKGPGYSQSFQPTPLSILVYGSEDLITSTFETREWTKQFFGNLQSNTFLSGFIPRLDFATLIIMIFPILMIFLLSDFIRDEIDEKTLLSCKMFGVNSTTFLASKLITSFFSIFFICSLAIASGFFVIALLDSSIEGLLTRYFYFSLVAGIYILFWNALLLVAQIMLKNRLKSIAVSICLWISIVFLLPAMHVGSLAGNEKAGATSIYYREKTKILLAKKESFNYFDLVKEKKDIDPFNDYGNFSSIIENEMTKCKECTIPPITNETTFSTGIRQSPFAWFSPTFITVTTLAELMNTGVLDFVNFRLSMFSYFEHFVKIWKEPSVKAWLRNFSDQPPIETLKKLDDVSRSRVPLNLIEANLSPLFFLLLANAIVGLIIYFLFGAWGIKTAGADR